MSVPGQQRTSSAMSIYVRFRGLSGHSMSAFRNRCNFPLVMSAYGGKADVPVHLSERLLIATSGHSRLPHLTAKVQAEIASVTVGKSQIP